MLLADGVDVITGKPLDVMNSKEVKRVYMEEETTNEFVRSKSY